MAFELTSSFMPTGDQPEAIDQLVNGLNQAEKSASAFGCNWIWKNVSRWPM